MRPELEKKLLSLAGFAVRAGRVTLGVPLTLEALRRGARGKKPLVILEAADTSEATHKRITDKAGFYAVPAHRLTADGQELAHALGKAGERLCAVGICEEQLAGAILSLLRAESCVESS